MAADTTYQSPPAKAFPTPSTTPRRDSSVSLRRGSFGPSSSPISVPAQTFSPDDGRSDYEDIADEDSVSPLDPRRFTPTLHASLVSEILNLRRDVESKTKAIDVLERTLDDSRIENEDLSERLSKNTRETRSLKHQLKLLEGGSSSALTELAKERDDALENITDVRKKLDQAQKKARSREEEVERTVKLWDHEKELWSDERRALERKVHVVEGRLKAVLNEVAAVQEAGSNHSTPKGDEAGLAKDETAGRDSDSASVHFSSQGRRRSSATSMSSDEEDENERNLHNVRYSVASVVNIQAAKGDGMNLADELAFDEGYEFGFPEEDMRPHSPEALPEERPASVNSQLSSTMGMGAKARKILGLSLHDSDNGQGVKADGLSEPGSPPKVTAKVVYQDTGIQYSPPPSPPSLNAEQRDNHASSTYETKDSGTFTVAIDMVSTSCQTVDELPTPPRTPKVSESSAPAAERAPVVSTSVQTEEIPVAEPEQKRASLSPQDAVPQEIEVPMIAIHPPHSEPPSPRGSVVLPPQTKNASCQASFGSAVDSRTIGIQTEPIRVDQRPVKLPASLLPSAIPDLPLSTGISTNASSQDPPIQPYRPPPPRITRDNEKPPLPAKAPSRSKLPRVQAYPGNNDDGPLSEESKTDFRRPLRSSSLFAGFDQDGEQGSSENTKDIFTDDAFLNRPFASYTLQRGKMVSTQERPSLEETATLPEIEEHLLDPDAQLYDITEAGDTNGNGRTGTAGSLSMRQQDIRRAAMISSGAAAHQKMRSRTPSEPSLDSGSASGSSVAPPFPVPVRLSSRKFLLEGSEGRQSPSPSHPRNFSDRARPTVSRRPTLRRVQSATTMSTDQHERPSSRSSPSISSPPYAPESPRHPSLPFDDITAPGGRRGSVRRPNLPQAFAHERQTSAATSIQPTSVVDAIAQTMVGEWMYKYVRRRKSFGGVGEQKDNWEGRNADEVSANITNSGVRHKRWVWLAPYERAVMWSSKQPTSGPALLGKSGRKLTIQSVLDVKDDTPLPKGASPQSQFNRSILILTPQRALKFTATSVERHYVWLTALSFLSHSPMGLHDLETLPPAPQEEFASPAPAASLRRNPIRDSIKVAKGRPRPMPKPRGKRPLNQPEPVPELPPGLETVDSRDAADPPTVPRFSNHNHTRKRSNTAPRIPAIRSFSSQATMPSVTLTRGSSEAHGSSSNTHGSVRSSLSHRTSETSGGANNFFDAIGTVRMEAFIDQTESNRHRMRARHARKVSSPSPWSVGNHGHSDVENSTIGDEESFRHDDPFRGF